MRKTLSYPCPCSVDTRLSILLELPRFSGQLIAWRRPSQVRPVPHGKAVYRARAGLSENLISVLRRTPVGRVGGGGAMATASKDPMAARQRTPPCNLTSRRRLCGTSTSPEKRRRPQVEEMEPHKEEQTARVSMHSATRNEVEQLAQDLAVEIHEAKRPGLQGRANAYFGTWTPKSGLARNWPFQPADSSLPLMESFLGCSRDRFRQKRRSRPMCSAPSPHRIRQWSSR